MSIVGLVCPVDGILVGEGIIVIFVPLCGTTFANLLCRKETGLIVVIMPLVGLISELALDHQVLDGSNLQIGGVVHQLVGVFVGHVVDEGERRIEFLSGVPEVVEVGL